MHIPEMKSIPEIAYDSLMARISDFQRRLADDEELGVVAYAGASILHVESVSRDGHMISFDGSDDQDRYSRIIQHYSQVAVQLVAVPKLRKEARRIGF